jgi:hypothetical protein
VTILVELRERKYSSYNGHRGNHLHLLEKPQDSMLKAEQERATGTGNSLHD